MRVRLFAVTAVVCSAFMDRSSPLHLFSLPELKGQKHRQLSANGHAGQGYRMLKPNDKAELPEIHDSHKFVGITSVGFVDYNTISITPPTTIVSDDYFDLLASADFSCAPVPVPDAADNAAPVHRLSVTFPGGAPADVEAFQHLVSRFSTASSFVYGVETLLVHPSLEKTADCVVHAGTENPYFSIVDAGADAGGFTLTLTPTLPARAFTYMSVSLTYNPNITAEVARRRAEGLDLGDARELAEHEDRERTLGVSKTETLARLALNWDGSKATTAKVGLLGDTTTLYCNNCYFYLNAAVTMNLKVCAIWQSGGTTYYYDPSVPATQTKGVYYASGACASGPEHAGCKTTSDTAARAATDCKPIADGGLGTSTPGMFNLGMSIEAFFEGSAGFNFEIKSDGIAAAKAYPSTCTKAASNSDSFTEGLKASGSKCSASSLPAPFDKPVTLPTITVSVAAVPVQLDTEIMLKGAGYVEASMPNFKLSFGASAAVTCKLGGRVQFKEIPLSYIPELDTALYKDFTATYSKLPFVLSGFDNSALATDITFTPITTLKVWKAIPIYTSPIYQMKYSLTTGSSARRLGYSLPAFRNLQTCSSGLNSAAVVKGGIGVALGTVKTFDAVKAVTAGVIDLNTKTGVSSFDVDLISAKTLADPSSNALAATGALSSDAASKCVTVGQSVSTGGNIPASGGGGASGGGDSNALGLGLCVTSPPPPRLFPSRAPLAPPPPASPSLKSHAPHPPPHLHKPLRGLGLGIPVFLGLAYYCHYYYRRKQAKAGPFTSAVHTAVPALGVQNPMQSAVERELAELEARLGSKQAGPAFQPGPALQPQSQPSIAQQPCGLPEGWMEKRTDDGFPYCAWACPGGLPPMGKPRMRRSPPSSFPSR
jgi:hypothetical protein